MSQTAEQSTQKISTQCSMDLKTRFLMSSSEQRQWSRLGCVEQPVGKPPNPCVGITYIQKVTVISDDAKIRNHWAKENSSGF